MGTEGTTTINNDVLVKIAVQTAQGIEGVAQVGASSAGRSIVKAFGGGQTSSSGINVNPGDPGSGETSFSLTIATLFGYSIPQVVRDIREAISGRVKELTGLTVRRVDVHVEDIKEQAEQGKASIPLVAKIRGQDKESKEQERAEKSAEVPESVVEAASSQLEAKAEQAAGTSSKEEQAEAEPVAAVSASKLAVYMKGIDFPADKEKILECARANSAPEDVMQFLNMLPERQYNFPTDVESEFGKMK